jgi:hypothetical protein
VKLSNRPICVCGSSPGDAFLGRRGVWVAEPASSRHECVCMRLINKYCTGMETYRSERARVTRHRDENTNLLLVRLILLRRHAE